jgi:nucleoredoxin
LLIPVAFAPRPRSCRRFTPELAALYTKLTAEGKPFEVVFVSSDKAADAFEEYCAEMPWLALPYADRDRKTALAKRFKVSGLPTLVLLDADSGAVHTTEGRDAVSESPEGFPWAPLPLHALLGDAFVDAAGAPRALSGADAPSHVALYFSASWCPPCRRFTPKLVEEYNKLRSAEGAAAGGARLEVIFVSGDNDEASFKEYLGHMPWLAVPYADEARRSGLNRAAGVRGIPALVLCERNAAGGGALRVVNPAARGAVEASKPFPDGWLPPVVPAVDDDEAVEALNSSPTLCVLAEAAPPAAAAAAIAALAALKRAQAAAGDASSAGGGGEPLRVCIAEEETGVSQQIRNLCRLGPPSEVPAMVLLDFANDAFFVPTAAAGGDAAAAGAAPPPRMVCTGDVCVMPSPAAPGGVTEAGVAAFVAEWRAGKAEARSVGAE